MRETREKECRNCKRNFSCFSSDCWCNSLPMIIALEANKDCLCFACLKNKIVEEIKHFTDNLTSRNREKIKALGEVNTPIEGIDYYLNEKGYKVFTSWYHLRRGNCCTNGCRHCPYKKNL